VLGHVPPDRFIPVAEEGGLIEELGQKVLRRACADVATMSAALNGAPLRLAVNMSPRQFASRTLLAQIESTLHETGLDPALLELEITEGILMDDHHDVLQVLHDLKALGASIVVDDFGQGYSSLAYLTRFPIDRLKIDRTFVWRLSTTTADAALVDAILAMAHALSMTVVAEGVETTAQETYLRERGCEEGQGYLYSKGVSVDELVRVARRIGTVGS
jgi:EAL domain-containing protein (putative c-di-GMP-specific phosphodiesterase class I)